MSSKKEMILGVQLLIVIICTQITSIFYGGIPYFPIEISRSAASPYANIVFKIGVLSLFPTLVYEKMYHLIGVWIGVLIAAFFDDVNYWTLHTFGVAMIFFSPIPFLNLSHVTFRERLLMLMVGFVIFVVKISFKFLAIWIIELNGELNVTKIFYTGLQVMYNGSKNPGVVVIFQMTGVLQWLSFYIVSKIFV